MILVKSPGGRSHVKVLSLHPLGKSKENNDEKCGYNNITCYFPLFLLLATALYSDLQNIYSQVLFVK